jgi:hypothetical protein
MLQRNQADDSAPPLAQLAIMDHVKYRAHGCRMGRNHSERGLYEHRYPFSISGTGRTNRGFSFNTERVRTRVCSSLSQQGQ